MPDLLTGLPWWVRASLGVGCGLATACGFAPLGWWPLLLVGIAALGLLCVSAPRWWTAVATGLFFGIGFLAVTLRWMTAIFVEAMLGLVALESLFFALLGLLIWSARSTRAWPVLAAGSWLLVEALYSRVPFDGFPWMRLGYAMVDSPLAGLLPFVGVAGVTFATALLAHVATWIAMPGRLRGRVTAVVGLVVLIGVSFGGTAWRPDEQPRAGDGLDQVAVGFVQGNAPGGGVFGLGQARTITRNHLDETRRLMARVATGDQPRPDFVVWPENGTDMDLFRDALTGSYVNQALAATGTPLFLGTITMGPGPDERQTASIWLDPAGGVVGRYDKRDIVPFGEWVPYRSVLLPLFPILEYVGPQSIPGTTPGVIAAQVRGRPLKVGTIICYEVAFDQTVREAVTAGAEILVVQSSNAMYTGTDQVHQQFAITRARAAELRREILVVTTTGISGLIRADGSIAFTLPEHQAASGVVDLPTRHALTPVVTLGPIVEGGLALATLIGLLALAFARFRAGRRGHRAS